MPRGRWWLKLVLLAVAAGLVLLVAWALVFPLRIVTADSDFFSFWAAGRLLGTGGNPYDPPQWLQIHQQYAAFLENPYYVYPLPLAVLFIPLGMLSLPAAAFLWLCLGQVFILAALIASLYPVGRKRAWLLAPFVVAGVYVFRPAVITLWNGQLSSLWLLGAALAAYCWARQRWMWGGLAAGLLCLKPAGPGTLLALMALWLVMRRQWRGLAGIGISAAALGASAFIFRPDWLQTWLAIGPSKVAVTWGLTYSPTIWGAIAKASGGAPYWPWLAGAASAALVVASLWVTARAKLETQWQLVFGVMLPVALVITPYLWNYDQLILQVPIVGSVALLDAAEAPFVVVATLPLVIDIVGVGLMEVANGVGHDIGSVLLPAVALAAFGAARAFASRHAGSLSREAA
jgi:hypothetical protein